MNELYHKYRPKSFKQVLGQSEVVQSLTGLIKKNKVPHTTLFHGPSGCGKTTIARILASKLGCQGSDLREINSADFRGIDTIRDIRGTVGLSPLMSPCRVWIIDECHQLSSQAQQAFLKLLEDTPTHVYFMLCTTDPHKLIKAVRSRCTDIKVKRLDTKTMEELLNTVLTKERIKIADSVFDKIVEVADGSARKALVLLHQVLEMDDDEALELVQCTDLEKQAIELARALIKPGVQWKEISALIKAIDEEPESLRRMILGYAASVALNGGPLAQRAIVIIDCFSSNYFDVGKAGLVWSCWQIAGAQSGKRR